ncbi:translation elongation factor 4 [Candidatus Aminicenantes bacterium AC-708-M15]|jgi:GTP-binding protein LepA|nr:translation elongation factor 4 [SCandidatus Aminicenantes bacterium Aminicenantia_JdfR_composite]MCP2597483.1 translation elongation factor 4 [Candidatus Aminicenantes bacterium AC-335-G13]MCP2598452.1 translation elongation factor 4 [Candidatus Aminicenantes bacterium AC-335-L06]MCP2604164.1 translation elongation factor 4 [Candidatus Aminicenantes bacterium AC-708-M15]MCP2618573.1 translation elongation factor 4 [Candidatus Aminicenantes bacterium AC-335-A11]
MEKIRNFALIAHIDHGKSTLADRLLEITNALPPREMRDQVLDSMELEQEKGITIKAHTVRLIYKAKDNNEYILNLIDTPGHVDFTYEVSRSLAACEGALLIVDASQGVEAQTLSNTYLALENDLILIPVINKIDLPNADISRTQEQLKNLLGFKENETILISAKYGDGIEEVLESIIKRIPPPKGEINAPLKALIFDSWFDPYRGAIVLIRIFNGIIEPGMKIKLMSTGVSYTVEEIGVLTPKPRKVSVLKAGEVGYMIAGIKELSHTRIGDTITEEENPTSKPFPGFREVKPMVFASFFPIEGTTYLMLRDALQKLSLNDASLRFEPENSPVLGAGFRCGFLGLLHREIIQERLEREFDLNLISTAPNVQYKIYTNDGKIIEVNNPSKFPSPEKIEKIEEPYITAYIITPDEYLGNILKLVESRRGEQKGLEYIGPKRVLLTYDLPLNEIIFDFYNQLKSVSHGYASLDYQFSGYKESSLVKIDLLINKQKIDALSIIAHEDKAYQKARALLNKLKEVIPRQLFEVTLQAAIGKRVIAKEVIKALRKDVTAKLYGGDFTRKMKLLEKQKRGKKRMKKIGKVNIPQEAFLEILKV